MSSIGRRFDRASSYTFPHLALSADVRQFETIGYGMLSARDGLHKLKIENGHINHLYNAHRSGRDIGDHLCPATNSSTDVWFQLCAGWFAQKP